MANEVTNFNIDGVDHAVKDEGGRALIAALQQAIDALTGGDTTTAIETFQEVIDFLSGVTDDETLIGKLNALSATINAKYSKPASGIPVSDLASTIQTAITLANSAYQKPNTGIPATDIAPGVVPDVSSLATKTELAGKVDKVNGKGLSTNDYTTEEKTKLAGLPTTPVTSISVNGQTPQTPNNGNVNLVVQDGEDGITPHIGQDGYWYIGTTNTEVKAQGPQGPAGNVQVDGNGNVLIVNNLEDGGTGAALSAEMGKELAGLVDELGYDVITTQHTQSLEVDSQSTGTVNADAESQTCEIDWDVPQSGVPAFTNIALYPTNGSVPSSTPITGANVSFFNTLPGDYANGGAKSNHILLRCATFTTSGTVTLVARYYFVINEATQEVTDMSTSQKTMNLPAGTYTILSYGDTTFASRPNLADNTGSVEKASAFIVDLTDTYGSGNEPAKADVVGLFGDIRLGSSDSSYTPAGSSAVLSVTRGGTVVDTATYGTDTEITVQGGDVLSLSGSGSASIDIDYTTTERQKRENVWTNQVASLLAVVLQHVTFDDASTGQAAASALITLLTTQNQQS